MAEHQVRRLPVVEEDGRLVGILAQADIAQTGHDALTGETVQQISQTRTSEGGVECRASLRTSRTRSSTRR